MFLSDNIVFENYSLESYNTFHFSVKADFFSCFTTVKQLRNLIIFAKSRGLPFFVLGGGANVLFSKDYEGIIIHPVSRNVSIEDEMVIADAGVRWDSLVERTVEAGLGGLENLSHIPGSVGASPVQNIGAYGVEAKDSIIWVEYMGVEDLNLHRISASDCRFGYRDSIFKHELKDRAIITRVAFKLSREYDDYPYNVDYGALRERVQGNISVKNIRNAVIDIRSSKLPDPSVLGNAGSFFRNPEIEADKHEILRSKFEDIVSFQLANGRFKISAGWMIEKTGWKGRSMGNAAVHDRQALVLVNLGGASGSDVIKLSDAIRKDVSTKFGVELQPEVIFL